MNIEQYEYMQGPHNAVGLKFLLHHQDAIPLVQDFGDHVPAGMHTFVAVSVSKVSSILFVFNGGAATILESGQQIAKLTVLIVLYLCQSCLMLNA